MVAFGLPLGLLTVWMEKTYVGAAGSEWELPLVDRLLVAGRAVWFYAGKLAWPHPLIFYYPRWTIDASAAWQYLFPVAALALLAALWAARGRIGRGPLAAALIFGGVLVPAIGFFAVFPFRYSFVADHYQYHASIALVALAAAALTTALGARSRDSGGRANAQAWLVAPLALGLLAPLAWMSYERIAVYQDELTLSQNTLSLNPLAFAAYNNVGVSLQREGKTDEALANYREAVRINPRYSTGRVNLAELLEKTGHVNEARAEYEATLANSPDSLDAISAHVHLAFLAVKAGRYEEAAAHGRGGVSHRSAPCRCTLLLRPRAGRRRQPRGGPRPRAPIAPLQARLCRSPARGGSDVPGRRTARSGGQSLREGRGARSAQHRLSARPGFDAIANGRLDPGRGRIAEKPVRRSAQRRHSQPAGNGARARGDVQGAIAEFRAALASNPHHDGATTNLRNMLSGRRS